MVDQRRMRTERIVERSMNVRSNSLETGAVVELVEVDIAVLVIVGCVGVAPSEVVVAGT
jgi:hypothetical protein